jgi:hypothetical protein
MVPERVQLVDERGVEEGGGNLRFRSWETWTGWFITPTAMAQEADGRFNLVALRESGVVGGFVLGQHLATTGILVLAAVLLFQAGLIRCELGFGG